MEDLQDDADDAIILGGSFWVLSRWCIERDPKQEGVVLEKVDAARIEPYRVVQRCQKRRRKQPKTAINITRNLLCASRFDSAITCDSLGSLPPQLQK